MPLDMYTQTLPVSVRKTTGKPSKKKDQIVINPEINNKINEEKESTAVMAFGRFNPPTVGHEKLIHKVAQVAKEHDGSAHVIASHTENKPKDPLPQNKKIGYLKKVAPESVHVSGSSKAEPSFLHAAKKINEAGHKHLVMVAGSDRVNEYKEKLNHYNGKEGHYNFKSIKVVSSGERDPDAEGVEGMSGTKMRAHARAGEMSKFKSGLPKALHPHAEEIANHIKSVNENVDYLFKQEFTTISPQEFDLIEKHSQDQISDSAHLKLLAISEEHGMPLAVLEQVVLRGVHEWYDQPTDNKTAEQNGFNRLNSFINKGQAYQIDADLAEGLKNPKDNPCWKGFKPVGTKKKNGKEVPNCVPEEFNLNIDEKFKQTFHNLELVEGPSDTTPRPGPYEVAIHNTDTGEKLKHYKIKHATSVFHAQNIARKIAGQDSDLKSHPRQKINVVKHPDIKENLEINEISTETKLRYVAKAASSTNEPKSDESHSDYVERVGKRLSGIKKALRKTSPADRFQKESVQIPDKMTRKLKKVSDQLDKSVKTHHKQSELIKKLVSQDVPDVKEEKNCGCGQNPCITHGNNKK